MKNMLKRDFILNIASDTGINPAFIEKDWYAVQLLRVINEFENDRGVDLIFFWWHQSFKRLWYNKTLFRRFGFFFNCARPNV